MLNSTIAGPQQNSTNYFKFYLPILVAGSNPHLSQSITMIGNNITKVTQSGINNVRINVTFPNGKPLSTQGFDWDFFNFDHTISSLNMASETVNLPANSVIEFYVGKVIVSLGQV
jgi:hypothetical protein